MIDSAVRNIEIVYDMLPAQERLRNAEAPYVLLAGGYGSGKTYALCMESILLSVENKGLINGLVSPSVPSLKKDILPTLKMCFALSDIEYKYYAQTREYDKMIYVPAWNGYIQLASGDDPTSLKGPTWASVGFNEPGIMKEEVWEVGISRVRDPKAKRIKHYACGTPEGYNWLYDEFIKNASDDHEVIYADTRENTHLRPDYAKRLLANFDSLLIEEKVKGRFVDTKRFRVYYGFDMKHSVKDLAYDPHLPLVHSWDFNVNPMSTAVIQVHREEIWVIDEIVIETSNTTEVCKEFIRRYGAYGKNHQSGVFIFGDASGRARTTASDNTDYSIIEDIVGKHFQEFSINVPRGNPAVSDRINVVNLKLEDAEGTRRLLFDTRATSCQEAFIRTVYKKGTGEVDKGLNIEHLTDAIGYFIYEQYEPFMRLGDTADYIDEPEEEGIFVL